LDVADDGRSGNEAMTDRVAVIIVNFNCGETLMRCLDGVRAQTLPPSRVIVVDNASFDGSATRAKQAFPEFEFVLLTENTGFAAANNIAAAMVCDCEWLALLNPDAYAASDWLANLLTAARCSDTFSFFASRMLMDDDPAKIDGAGDVYHVSGLAWRACHGASVHELGDMPFETFAPCAAAALYRRSEFMTAGGFDESFFCYMEDVDLGFRLRLRGHRCMYVPGATVRHSGSAASGGRHSDFAVYHGHRNLVWAYVKNVPGGLFWLLLPAHLVLNLVSIVWFVLRGQGAVILRAKLTALAGLPKAWQARRIVQAQRVVEVGEIWHWMDKALVPVGRAARCRYRQHDR
jgi:GT2 family glycosyltransferase